ncbi:MAG: alkaline phosphatase family protein [Reichenbachiella sp.]|uniref:alkaline phosphatase family protein n=1 Tax=Reichenbachiella sp. TaxID=2184521 RepID=UPI003264BD74
MMSKAITRFGLFVIVILTGCTPKGSRKPIDKPRLVIGIVIDQMRADYLERFSHNFGARGFNRLIRNGFYNKNTHYNYVPTATAPGHASIFTGTTPSNHGIVGNKWYDRELKREITSVEDSKEAILGLNGIEKEHSKVSASPRRLLAHTISDQLKLQSPLSKVIGVSLKDRSAILPAGHLADYALWYDKQYGQMVTSTYYGEKAPIWLAKFNARKLPDSLLSQTWSPLKGLEEYQGSEPDDSPYEKIYNGKNKAVFPYDLSELRKENGGYGLLWETPFGNTLVTKTAKEVIQAEQLGQDDILDFLSVSYSSTDLVGHAFGVRSKELEDTYARMDWEVAELLSFLDRKVGADNYLVFLTADHGAADHPGFLQDKGLPGKFFNQTLIKETTNRSLQSVSYKQEPFLYYGYSQVYLTEEAKYDLQKDPSHRKPLLKALEQMKGVKSVSYLKTLTDNEVPAGHMENIVRGYHQGRSGDIYIAYHPGWLHYRKHGASHGTFYKYDTHVPLIWYGTKIRKGESFSKVSITDIAPTLSMMLDIPLPNAATGQPIVEILSR